MTMPLFAVDELLTRWREAGLLPVLFDGQAVLLNVSGLPSQEERHQVYEEFRRHRAAIRERLYAEREAAFRSVSNDCSFRSQ